MRRIGGGLGFSYDLQGISSVRSPLFVEDNNLFDLL